MNTKIFNSIVLAVCGILVCFIMADITGEWIGKIEYHNSKFPVTYNFKVDGSKLSGTMQTPIGSSNISNGQIINDKIKFDADISGNIVPHTGVIYRDSIVLKVYYNGEELNATLLKNTK